MSVCINKSEEAQGSIVARAKAKRVLLAREVFVDNSDANQRVHVRQREKECCR